MHLILPVAVKPYVKKYIGSLYPVEPFVMSKNNEFGIYLINCLEKPTLKKINRAKQEDIDRKVYSEILNVYVSENYWSKKGGFILPERQQDFNKFVGYLFHNQFYAYVKMRIGKKGSINDAILEFRDSFDICEDELSFKTIQRAFQRRNETVTRSLSA